MVGRDGDIVSPKERKRQPEPVESPTFPGVITRTHHRNINGSGKAGLSMKISMHTMLVEQCSHTLANISKCLDKGAAYAETKKFDSTVLVNARIAPDMFPLSRQVQIACDMVKNGVARLAGQDAPKFDDNEKTIDELKARIARTIDYIKSVPANALENSEARDIKIPMRDRTLEMQGLPYLRTWVLPNFYFHATMVYALLRHNGVDLGKPDFLGAA
jgi:uncharacterized protein